MKIKLIATIGILGATLTLASCNVVKEEESTTETTSIIETTTKNGKTTSESTNTTTKTAIGSYYTVTFNTMGGSSDCGGTDEEIQAVLTDYSTNVNNIPKLYGLNLKSPLFDNALFDMDALFKDSGNGTFQITITFEEGTEEFNAGYIVLAESPYSVVATYEDVAEESQQYLDLIQCQNTEVNGSKSIWLAGAGTYILIYNDSTGEITIETLV